MKHILRASVSTVHWGYYDSKLESVLKVKSGDIIEIYTVSGSPRTVKLLGIEDKIPKELREIHEKITEREAGHILVGPVSIDGATVDDTLEIQFLDIKPWIDFGYNVFSDGKGVIPEDFPYSRGKYIPIDKKGLLAVFADNVKIPIKPFFGNLGVAPAPHLGRINSRIPGPHGGNFDNKELVASSKIYLPIFNEGALFSIGDGHSCQGDGEVDVSALETCMRGLVRLSLIKGVKIKWPMAENQEHFIFMGFNTDLEGAIRMALRNTIEFLVKKGLEKDNAYMFCSLCVDFRITQAVNPVKGVHAIVPKNVLRDKIDSMI